ncbi:MAG: DNA-directed RNA polymerase subunit alpha [Bacteroidota bacterium]
MSYPFIKMPDGVILEETSSANNYGKFVVQPLERGFGVTLGNAFRRVLLSSIAGAAITAVKFDGVLHEFTSIPGVVEDVTEIILNLKKIRIKILNKKTSKMEFSMSGGSVVTAKDIQEQCSDIEILNPDQHIATLNDDAKFNMELRFGYGKGYVAANDQNVPDRTIGLIMIDSIYTPLTKVTYDIKNVRIGESNDYEQLILEVHTDGSITPEDALSNAGQILRDHINLFINFDVEQEEEKIETEVDLEAERIKKILLTSVDDLELSVRSHNCLKAANIKTLGDLVRKEESEMLKFRNFGRKSLSELTEIVEVYGLDFGMDVDKYINYNSDNN